MSASGSPRVTCDRLGAVDKTLVLLRHAKAEPLGDLGDIHRPLATRGRDQARLLGERLAEEAGPFDVALVSAAARTRETYRLLAGTSPLYPAPRVDEELYGTTMRGLLRMLNGLEESAARVLVVGHEPVMSSLAHLLHRENDDVSTQLSLGIPTGTAVVLDVAGPWAELDRKSALVRAVLRPDV